jgi:hypothetical protein
MFESEYYATSGFDHAKVTTDHTKSIYTLWPDANMKLEMEDAMSRALQWTKEGQEVECSTGSKLWGYFFSLKSHAKEGDCKL